MTQHRDDILTGDTVEDLLTLIRRMEERIKALEERLANG